MASNKTIERLTKSVMQILFSRQDLVLAKKELVVHRKELHLILETLIKLTSFHLLLNRQININS